MAEASDDAYLLLAQAFEAVKPRCGTQRGRNGGEIQAYLTGEGAFADRQVHPLPRLLLLDLRATGPQGLELLKWLQHQPGLESLPTIVLDADPQTEQVDLAYRFGASSFLKKPQDLQSYNELVQSLADYWLNWNILPDREAGWPQALQVQQLFQ